MKDIRQKAKELMRGACRLCSICDGRVCAGEVPGMGGLGSGTAFKNNVKALAEIALNMRLIHTPTREVLAAGSGTVPVTDELLPLLRDASGAQPLGPTVRTKLPRN